MTHRTRSRRKPGVRLHASAGVTLIELIIGVGILATLLAIAIPYYQNYATRARITAMLAEVSTAKPAAELLVMEGVHGPTIQDPAAIGLSGPTHLCPTLRVTVTASSGRATIFCEAGFWEHIQLVYDAETGWTCKTLSYNDRPRNRWAPEGCSPVFG
ncbi:pilin [Stenotrophomonas sp. TWI1183]|uniref:pilin n=1 Tax=Stenotrophomonas sp. TWI1183 TaxID=3136799 RepID=UPI003208BAD8